MKTLREMINLIEGNSEIERLLDRYELSGYILPEDVVDLIMLNKDRNGKLDIDSFAHAAARITVNFPAPTYEIEDLFQQLGQDLLGKI